MDFVNKGLSPAISRSSKPNSHMGARLKAHKHGKLASFRMAELKNPDGQVGRVTWSSSRQRSKYRKHLVDRTSDNFKQGAHERDWARKYASADEPRSSYKESGVGKSMYQSRFGGASAVAKNLEDVEKGARLDKFSETRAGKRWLKHDAYVASKRPKYDDSLIMNLERHYVPTKQAKRDAVLVGTSAGVVGAGVAVRKNMDIEAMNRITRRQYRLGQKAGLLIGIPAGIGVNVASNKVNSKKIKKAEQTYDEQGNPVSQRQPLMSGNAKLGTAGAGVGLYGAKRMAFANTIPGALKSQADAAQSRVDFQERLANSQIKRVQDASKIRNPVKRNKQVRFHQYYSDKAQGHLADAQAKKITADNALKAAPAKRAAHLKSGGALVATGAALGGLAAYNNAQERKNLKGK